MKKFCTEEYKIICMLPFTFHVERHEEPLPMDHMNNKVNAIDTAKNIAS